MRQRTARRMKLPTRQLEFREKQTGRPDFRSFAASRAKRTKRGETNVHQEIFLKKSRHCHSIVAGSSTARGTDVRPRLRVRPTPEVGARSRAVAKTKRRVGTRNRQFEAAD